MNPRSKKFISLFLVFSLIILSVNLFAKERRGAEIIITKKNGAEIKGELIAVKLNYLLVLTKWTGRDVSVDITDVEAITIVKKSKAGKGAIFGGLVGVSCSVYTGILNKDVVEGMGVLEWTIIAGLLLVPIGAGLGALIGATTGPAKKTIHIEGMTDSEIQENLDYLRKKARVRDYR